MLRWRSRIGLSRLPIEVHGAPITQRLFASSTHPVRGIPVACRTRWLPGTPHVQPLWHGGGAQWSQLRASGGRASKHGRLEHFRFGVTRVKGRYYYRFHKLIGKWNWRKYKEKYVAPRALENRQRWIPGVSATYHQERHSRSWYWRLPIGLADGVTADEVLEAWIKFRHKLPKKTYHYFKALSRLSEVGGCEPSDWRLKFILSRLRGIHRKVLNMPRLAKYYAELRAIRELEHLSRFFHTMLHKYSVRQLVLTAHSFGLARLQDKKLFSEIARLLEPELALATPLELVQVTEAFAAVEVCHYTFLTRISAQVQLRVQQESENEAPPGSCPSFAHLARLAEAFARLKFQDYSYFEMCCHQAEQLLCAGLPGPTPPSIAQLCAAASRLKIHDVKFFEVVLAHVRDHWYDYPASSLAQVGAAIAPVFPRDVALVQEVYRKMFEVIEADRDLLTLKDVELAARFMAEVDHKGEFFPGFEGRLRHRIKAMRDDTKEKYDVARVAEIFARRCPEDRVLFSTLCKHLHRHLGFFEPVDFIRFSRGLALAEYRDDRVTHSLSKWAQKRRAEFSEKDWDAFLQALESLGMSAKRAAPLTKLAITSPLPLSSGLSLGESNIGSSTMGTFAG